MHDPSPSEPLPDLLAELLEDGAADPVVDARVRAVLHTIHEQLIGPPDELTRRRHLTRAARARRLVAARRQSIRLARTAAVGGILVFGLAAAGVLPEGLQRTVASAGNVVGVSLPSPSPATPAGDDRGPRFGEFGDERPHLTGDEADESAVPPRPTDRPPTVTEAAARAGERLLPPPAREHAAERAAQARDEAGPAEPADTGPAAPASDRAHEVAAAAPAHGRHRGNGEQQRSEAAPAHGQDRSAEPGTPTSTARASAAPGRGEGAGPPEQRRPGAGDGPSDHARAGARG